MIPVECVARGYLTGSGWLEYQRSGTVCGIELPAGSGRRLPAARADLHPGHQGGARRARRERRLRDRGRDGRAGGRHPDPGAHARRVRRGRGDRPRAGPDPGRHQVRVRHPARWHHRARRRGADAGFHPLLGCRDLGAGSAGSTPTTSSSSGTGCSTIRAGTGPPGAAPPAAAARDGAPPPGRSTSRRTNCSPEGRSPPVRLRPHGTSGGRRDAEAGDPGSAGQGGDRCALPAGLRRRVGTAGQAVRAGGRGRPDRRPARRGAQGGRDPAGQHGDRDFRRAGRGRADAAEDRRRHLPGLAG